MLAVPRDTLYHHLDNILDECKHHRQLLTVLGVATITVAALTPIGSFLWTAGIASSTLAGSGSAIGYISAYYNWGNTNTHLDLGWNNGN